MAFHDRHRFNWGLLVSAILAIMILPVLFGGVMFIGGARCEGRPAPCAGGFGLAWLVMGLAVAGLVGVGWLTNRVIAIFRARD